MLGTLGVVVMGQGRVKEKGQVKWMLSGEVSGNECKSVYKEGFKQVYTICI